MRAARCRPFAKTSLIVMRLSDDMKTVQTTPRELLEIQQQLADREPIFHRPEFGKTRADFEAMMAEDFWEVGASGKRYDRETVLRVLDERAMQADTQDSWRTEDFYCQQISTDTYLLTYTLHQGSRKTRRATLWRSTKRAWVIVYHQGTIVEPPSHDE